DAAAASDTAVCPPSIKASASAKIAFIRSRTVGGRRGAASGSYPRGNAPPRRSCPVSSDSFFRKVQNSRERRHSRRACATVLTVSSTAASRRSVCFLITFSFRVGQRPGLRFQGHQSALQEVVVAGPCSRGNYFARGGQSNPRVLIVQQLQ